MVSVIERAIIEHLFFLKESVKYTVTWNNRGGSGNKPPAKKITIKGTLEEKLFSEKVKTKITAPSSPGAIRFDAGGVISSWMPKLKGIPSEGFTLEHSRELSFSERKSSYSVTVEYFENEKQESITVTAEDEEKKKYTFAAIREKPIPEPLPYTLQLTYARGDKDESVSLNYQLRDYPNEREEKLQDFSGRVDKSLTILPKSLMPGVLGFTYLGENFMARRDDLVGETARMVDIHESIHTPDEYETRVLTDWIMSRERMKYKK
ncbi:hypothetical protein HYV84_03525 [Candidatus Woesearchaeota archaeon]|nr:hypothetical protein [Candidatus Woesearchaeota archaeon]